MAKALMVYGPTGGIASGAEINLFGQGSTTTETFTQVDATEAMTFSGLAVRVWDGNSGTATFTFRNNSANGNQVAAIAGTGVAEADPEDTDTVAASDPFNIAETDNGTNPSIAWARGNVSFASGHGNVHGAVQYGTGVVLDVASSTRYLALAGGLTADGESAIADAQFKVYGYDSAEALQVRVSANARTNDSEFSFNVNGSDVGTAMTVGAGVTGLLSVTGLGASLDPGDLLTVSATLGTGVEDLTIRIVAATLKSTSGESEVWAWAGAGDLQTRAASVTETFYPLGSRLNSTLNGVDFTEADARITVGFAHTARRPRLLVTANTYSGDATLKVYKNGTAVLTTTITAGATGWLENAVDTVDNNDTDGLSYGIVGGGTGSITIRAIGLTFSPIDVAVGLATETESALGAARLKAKTIGQAQQADSAFAPARIKVRAVGMAIETDAAMPAAALGGGGVSAAGAMPAGDYSFWTDHWIRLAQEARRPKRTGQSAEAVARDRSEALTVEAPAALQPIFDETFAVDERADEDDIEVLLLATI